MHLEVGINPYHWNKLVFKRQGKKSELLLVLVQLWGSKVK